MFNDISNFVDVPNNAINLDDKESILIKPPDELLKAIVDGIYIVKLLFKIKIYWLFFSN